MSRRDAGPLECGTVSGSAHTPAGESRKRIPATYPAPNGIFSNGAAGYLSRSNPGHFSRVSKIVAAEHFPRAKVLRKKVVLFSAAFTGERALPAPTGVAPSPATKQKQH